jgi:hypothetical protein
MAIRYFERSIEFLRVINEFLPANNRITMEFPTPANSEEATVVFNRHATNAAPGRARACQFLDLLRSVGQVCYQQRQNREENQHERD